MGGVEVLWSVSGADAQLLQLVRGETQGPNGPSLILCWRLVVRGADGRRISTFVELRDGDALALADTLTGAVRQ